MYICTSICIYVYTYKRFARMAVPSNNISTTIAWFYGIPHFRTPPSIYTCIIWFVVATPLKSIIQLGRLFPVSEKMFQTTNHI